MGLMGFVGVMVVRRHCMRGYPKHVLLTAILVTAAFGCGGESTGPGGGGASVTVRGRIVAAGPEAPTGLTATWRPRGGGSGVSAAVVADGRFSLDVPVEYAAGELLIDGPEPRRFHPFLFPFHADSVGDLDVVMIPRRWRVERGEYRGQEVGVPLDPVVEDRADNYLYSYFWGQGDPRPDPVRYLLDLAAWPMEALPAKAAFDRQGGQRPVSPEDSARIWGVLDRIEAVYGLDLFEPAVADPAWWPDPWRQDSGRVPGVIRIVLDPPSWSGVPLFGNSAPTWEQDLGPWAGGGRFSTFRVRARSLDAGVLVVGNFEPLRLADGLIPWETVLAHEVMHVMGYGHTCRVPSPMGPCQRTAEPSPSDVAYMEMLREVLRLEREAGTLLSVVPALVGERVLMLGQPALPSAR